MNYTRNTLYPTTNKTSTQSNTSVRFNDSLSKQFDDHEKFLTAKYPRQQMQLIRKRLNVEFWLDEQLQFLYKIKDDSSQEEHDQCPENFIDVLLDMENEFERRQFLIEKLRYAKQPHAVVMTLIDEILIRVKTL